MLVGAREKTGVAFGVVPSCQNNRYLVLLLFVSARVRACALSMIEGNAVALTLKPGFDDVERVQREDGCHARGGSRYGVTHPASDGWTSTTPDPAGFSRSR